MIRQKDLDYLIMFSTAEGSACAINLTFWLAVLMFWIGGFSLHVVTFLKGKKEKS